MVRVFRRPGRRRLASAARYLIEMRVGPLDRTGTALPFGMLVVNLPGSFVLGLPRPRRGSSAPPPGRDAGAGAVGFLGAYTTFSTLMLDSWRLIEDGLPALARVTLEGPRLSASSRSGAGPVARTAIG